jgi:hypothetical protein
LVKPTRPALALVGLVTAAIAATAVSTASAGDPVSAHLQRPLAGVDSGTFPGSEVPLGDRDNRGPRKAPLPGALPWPGSVASLTSSSVGSLRLNTTTPVLSATAAVLAAAKDAGSEPVAGSVFVGENPDATLPLLAGAYDLLVQAPGYGLQRFAATFTAGSSPTHTLRLLADVASAVSGATVSGDGIALADVIDDDEATLGVRAFDLEASSGGGQTFTTVYRSPDDFFPADKPRAVAPDLNLRTVTLLTPVVADTLRMVVRTNTCTGAPDFAGVEKASAAEALAPTDCRQTPNSQQVTITELQAFGAVTTLVAAPAAVPVAAGRASLPATGAEVALAVFGVLLIGIAVVVARRMRS